jgi:glycosyltransferase involved in cell wall biosynthesis
MRRAAVLIMPSEWYEAFPLTLTEAFAHGLPVIASRLGAMAEIVQDGVTGLHFSPGSAEDLAEKLRWAVSHPSKLKAMGDKARLEYEKRYTPETNYHLLMAIYEAAVKENFVS